MEFHLKARTDGSARLANLPASLLLAGIIGVALILLSPLNTPVIPRDEGVFVYIGKSLLSGQVPYRDLWDHKGPLIYFINALGLWLGNGGLWGIWLIESILLAASLMLLYGLLRRVLGTEAALFGIVAWLAGFAIVMGGNIIEEYAILPAVLSVLLALGSVPLSGLWLGLLAGLSFMLRPNEVAAPAVALAFLLVSHYSSGRQKAVARLLLQSMLGFGLVAAGFLAYFAWQRALDDFMDCVFVFNFRYVSTGGSALASLLAGAGYLIVPVLFAAVSVATAAATRAQALSPQRKRLFLVALVLLLVTVPLSLLSGRVYRHYYVAWLLPLSLLSAYGLHFLRELQRNRGLHTRLSLTAWAILILAAMVSVRIRAVPLISGGMPPDEARAVEGIRSAVPPGGELLFWGNETSYAVMADRRMAGRYIFLVPLLVPGYGEGVADELLAEITARRPIIIDTSATDPSIPSLEASAPAAYLEPIYSLIHRDYRLIGVVPGKNWAVWAPK